VAFGYAGHFCDFNHRKPCICAGIAQKRAYVISCYCFIVPNAVACHILYPKIFSAHSPTISYTLKTLKTLEKSEKRPGFNLLFPNFQLG
jgi:hypothetical protein